MDTVIRCEIAIRKYLRLHNLICTINPMVESSEIPENLGFFTYFNKYEIAYVNVLECR